MILVRGMRRKFQNESRQVLVRGEGGEGGEIIGIPPKQFQVAVIKQQIKVRGQGVEMRQEKINQERETKMKLLK